MRRRELLGKKDPYVFSASTTSPSVSYTTGQTSITIKSTYSGSNIGYLVKSYDSTIISSVTTAATSVTIKYKANSNLSSRSGTVVLEQNGSLNTITITLNQQGYINAYTFSAQSTTTSVTSSSSSFTININSKLEGVNQPYTVDTFNQTVISSVTTAATSITFTTNENSTSLDTRSGTIVLKQNGSNKTITITVNQSGGTLGLTYTAIVVDNAYNSSGQTQIYINSPSTPYTGTASVSVSGSSYSTYFTTTVNKGLITVKASSSIPYNYTSQEFQVTVNGVKKGFTAFRIGSKALPTIDGHEYHVYKYNSIKWASKVVGASKVGERGNYYQWGATTTGGSYYSGTESTLPLTKDVARQVMGGGWRMPTSAETADLRNYSNLQNTYENAVYNGNRVIVVKHTYNDADYLIVPCGIGGDDQNRLAFIWTSTNYSSTLAYDNSNWGKLYSGTFGINAVNKSGRMFVLAVHD